jgi:hypothetical protein
MVSLSNHAGRRHVTPVPPNTSPLTCPVVHGYR